MINTKDDFPKHTIKKLKKILSQVDIKCKEYYLPTFAGLHSVKLMYKNGRKLSAGKGTSKELAKASAYAELLERLQNGFCPQFCALTVPDAKLLSIDEIVAQDSIFIKSTITKYFSSYKAIENSEFSSARELLEYTNTIFSGNGNNYFNCLPFYSVKEEKTIFIPQDLIVELNSTTGMCAGNTPEEALVQGLSEALERYAGFKIIDAELTPPIIPEDEYYKFPHIKKMCDLYKKQGYSIEFRDCSLGENIPVVCLIIFNKKEHTYTTTFGAHPIFQIAIERCFSEYRLEKDELILKKENAFYPLSLDSTTQNKDNDLLRNLYDSIVHIDWNIFLSQPNWEFNKAVWKDNSTSNKTLLKELLNTTLKISDNIYIRDVSFLNFPSYWIVIPELTRYVVSKNMFELKNKVWKFLDKMPLSLDENSFYQIIEYLAFVSDFTEMKSLLNGVNNLEFAAAYAYSKNNLKKAEEYLTLFLKKQNRCVAFINDKTAEIIKNYITLKQKNIKEENIIVFLNNFFGKENVDIARNFWIDSNPTKKYLYIHKTKNSPITETEDTKLINNKLQKAYEENIPNQSNLINIINNL